LVVGSLYQRRCAIDFGSGSDPPDHGDADRMAAARLSSFSGHFNFGS